MARREKIGRGSVFQSKLPKITVEDLADFNESINLLVYGDSGVGKTPFATQLPRCVILSTERGAVSAKRYGSNAKLIKAPDWEHTEAAIEYLERHSDDFDWLVLDSGTKMQNHMLRWILRMVNADDESRDLDIPAIADHQKWQNMFKRFIDRIVDLDINTVIIATVLRTEDEEGEALALPNFIGKGYAISQYVCESVDGVYALKSYTDSETGDPYWKLLVRRFEEWFAKDRYNAFGGVLALTRPTILEVADAIMSSGDYEAAMAEKKAKKAAAAEEPEDDEDDEDEIEEPPRRKTRTPARKPARGQSRAARKPARGTAKTSATKTKVEEPEPDEDDFDPDSDEFDDADFD